MEAVARLHSAPGVALLAALAVLASVATALWLLRREPAPWVDLARRVLLILVVVEAALGLVLAARGSAPAEWIHWLYGIVIVVALLLPTTVSSARTPRHRTGLLAVGALLGAFMAWRLMGSG